MNKRKSMAEQFREIEAAVDAIPDTPRDQIPDFKEQTLGPTKALKEQFQDPVPAELTTFIPLGDIEVVEGLDRDESEFTGPEFDELVASIEQSGMNDIPIELRYTPGKPPGTAYQLVAGHRRFRALQALKIEQAYATVRELDDLEMFRLHDIENAKRAAKRPFSLARQLSTMWKSGRYDTQVQMAERLGRSKGDVSLYLGLYDDAPAALWLVAKDPGAITQADARLLTKAFKKEAFIKWTKTLRGEKSTPVATIIKKAREVCARPKVERGVADRIKEVERGDAYHLVLPKALSAEIRLKVLNYAKQLAAED